MVFLPWIFWNALLFGLYIIHQRMCVLYVCIWVTWHFRTEYVNFSCFELRRSFERSESSPYNIYSENSTCFCCVSRVRSHIYIFIMYIGRHYLILKLATHLQATRSGTAQGYQFQKIGFQCEQASTKEAWHKLLPQLTNVTSPVDLKVYGWLNVFILQLWCVITHWPLPWYIRHYTGCVGFVFFSCLSLVSLHSLDLTL